MRRWKDAFVAPLLLLWANSLTWAIPSDIGLDQLHHSRWSIADGAPAYARAMAQSGDGALWLGADHGLYRFDGVQFQRIQSPEPGGQPFGNVSALMAMPDGSLWIGLRFGGAYHWQAGRYTAHGEAQGLPANRSIFRFALGADGRVWAGTSDGLFLLQDARWRRVGAELGHPDRFIHDLAVDRSGTLWINGPDGVFKLPSRATRVAPVGSYGQGFLAPLSDGSLWFAHFDTALQVRDHLALLPLQAAPEQSMPTGLRYRPNSWPGQLIGDRDGGLWAADQSGGVMRLPRPTALRGVHPSSKLPRQAQVFGIEHGLSGHQVGYFFEDRDGSIWVSTDNGLDRFRIPRLTMHPSLKYAGLQSSRDRQLLTCNESVGAGSTHGPIPQLVAMGALCEALDQAPSGRNWWSINRRVWWQQGDQAGELPLPAEAKPVLSVPALKVDHAGTLWVSLVRQGLFRHRDGRWTRIKPGSNGYPDSRPISMGRDATGRVWLGYPGSQIALPDGEQAKVWGAEQGLRVGNVMVLVAHGDAMLIGGSEGLALLKEQRVTMLQGSGGERFEGVTGIVADGDDGFVWVQSRRSISRLRADELVLVAAEAGKRLQVSSLDHADGLRGLSPPQWPWPSAARTADGRLWFTTTSAGFSLDPEQMRRRPPPPALELRGLRVEDAEFPLTEGPSLPTGTRRIELSYAAINVAMPERVRYRYRLDGLDSNWRQTTARSADYTNLPPGHYTFRVAAANEDGPWSESGVALRFSIPPAFHQTAWFYALCAVAAALAIWCVYRLRIRQISRRLHLRAEAQAQERERIARDLHDTLLQSTQGLMLSVQALADRTPDGNPEKLRIERVLNRADAAMREGRRKVMDLRADDNETDLAAWLGDLADELSERGPARVGIVITGKPSPLLAGMRGETLRIAQEALLNAQQHAKAQEIELLIDYAPKGLRLQVIDDGLGIEPGLMDGTASLSGHWGLTGMRERARSMGASFSIKRGIDARTVVELFVPASLAYPEAAKP